MTHPSALRGALLGLGAMAVYAANDNIIKFLGMYNPFQIMFFSGIALAPIVLTKMALDKEVGTFRPRMPKWMAMRCAVNLVNTVFVVYAFGNMPLAQAYAIFFTMPLMVTLLAAWMLGEPISLWRGVAVLAGFVGVVIALQPGQIPLTWVHLAAVVGAIASAFNFVILRKTANAERPEVNIIYPMLSQLAVATLVLPFVYQPMPLAHLALAGAMAVCGFGGAALIIAAYRAAPAIIVAPMQYSQILWAALTAAFIFDEGITPATWAGLAVIIGAGLYILNSSRQTESA
ncbi:MAG: DMT family transporter [Cypionkella sp.]|nr:DMT family transporter [Cypionkella sp.]